MRHPNVKNTATEDCRATMDDSRLMRSDSNVVIGIVGDFCSGREDWLEGDGGGDEDCNGFKCDCLPNNEDI